MNVSRSFNEPGFGEGDINWHVLNSYDKNCQMENGYF